MLKDKRRFIIDDPTSYRGSTYKYYLGLVVSAKGGFLSGGIDSFESTKVSLTLQLLSIEDIQVVQAELLKARQKENPRVEQLVIMGIYPLQD